MKHRKEIVPWLRSRAARGFVLVFMWPVIKPGSVRQAKSVWCSKDRAKAWNDLMLKGVQPAAPTNCENPIDELVAPGKRLGARGTPMWFLRDGSRYTGARPVKEVVPLLDATVQRNHPRFTCGHPVAAYVLGLAFSFGWTPRIGPVPRAILTVSAAQATVPGRGALFSF